MHLLATTSGVIDGAAEPVDLQQSPGEIVILSAADSELASLAGAVDRLSGLPCTVRLANLLQLQHPYAVDLYVENTLRHARLVILRLLGGRSYWPYGLEQIAACAAANGQQLVVLPGDANPDLQLSAHSTVSAASWQKLHGYFNGGGAENANAILLHALALIGKGEEPEHVDPLPPAGIYRSNHKGHSHAVILFYRALIEGGQLAPVDALAEALEYSGHAVTAFYLASLKDKASLELLHRHMQANPPHIFINLTSFAASSGKSGDPLAGYDCPVLQGLLSSTSAERWKDAASGLPPRDLAMNVVLPELDGRIHGNVISFKSDSHWHAATECRIVSHQPVGDRISAMAQLAGNWLRLRSTPRRQRRIAMVLANYPVRDGRIANGVGYDSPASAVTILRRLKQEGYDVSGIPSDGGKLVHCLAARRTEGGINFPLTDYLAAFERLPEPLRVEVETRWGSAEDDPTVSKGAFNLPVLQLGNVAVGIQPSRGYNLDPEKSHHDPALVPPHAYIAFYLWISRSFEAQAIIHNGKHGNLEWLPGKSAGLSNLCYPDALSGSLPHIYPFIVNDPGEGTQAKRRTAAVIIDHLTPPLARAETYGPLKDLEAMIDEYYLASGLDARRAASLRKDILALTRSQRIDLDAGLTGDDNDLVKLDSYICELKEAQIRDGLHVLGQSPSGQQEHELTVALARVQRGLGEAGDASFIRALAKDFGFGDFDPLNCSMGEPWQGPRPKELAGLSTDQWRSNGDTVERLELFALQIIAAGPASQAVVSQINDRILPALRACGEAEMASLLAGLDGRRVAPGPSGAPTRGRIDVLPTGRNFYSLDNRTLPTPTAWALGQASATALLTRHLQDTGSWPQSLGVTAWGTSNMRTGGDDIAQVLALIGVKPVWDTASWRVTGFEVIPLAVLDRPRVDVTLRISGFFRDAFPQQIELLDKAIRACGALDEDEADNPIAARMRSEASELAAAGITESDARELAGHRIFGAKPGAYGAGLQAMIDEGIWNSKADLAAAYVTWGSFAYGAKAAGLPTKDVFRRRLASIEAVVQNQDNREHDLLDSDDYYQFEGGMSAAVETISGQQPRIYHNDHSRPERPMVRTLEEEVGRVMRSRVVNPKWIAGVKRHGYKGAFEITATVDYMFAFAATTGAVKSHHFDMAYDAFILDDETRAFIGNANPAALRELAQRLKDAVDRGLWTPRANSAYHVLEELEA